MKSFRTGRLGSGCTCAAHRYDDALNHRHLGEGLGDGCEPRVRKLILIATAPMIEKPFVPVSGG